MLYGMEEILELCDVLRVQIVALWVPREENELADYLSHLSFILNRDSVGGVVSAGESYVAAAIRELNEEVGIQDVSVEPLDGGMCQTYEDDQVSLMGRCFIVQAQSPLTFNDGEVAEAWWVHRDGLDELIRREKVLPDSLALLLPLLDF
jgi:8-oxo-dGTP pyrophosphatase MutT (NUDIX family)